MNYSYIRKSLLDKMEYSLLTLDDISIYISDIINYLELNDYLKDICLINCDSLAKYDFSTRVMKINYDGIIDDAIELYDGDYKDIILFVNLLIIQTCSHELVHIYQHYATIEINNDLFKIFKQEIDLYDMIDNDTYSDYYNCFIFERDAIVNSYETILLILKKHFNNKKMYNYFLYELASYLQTGYGFIDGIMVSPIEYLYNDLFKCEAPIIECNNDYDSMKLGCQLKNKRLLNQPTKLLSLIRKQNYLK